MVAGTAPTNDPDAQVTLYGAFQQFSGMRLADFAEAVEGNGLLAQLLGPSNDAPSYLAPATVNNGDQIRVPGDLDAEQLSMVGGAPYKFPGTVVQTPEGTYTLYPSIYSLNQTNAFALGGVLTVAGAIQGVAQPPSNPAAPAQAPATSDGTQLPPCRRGQH